MEFEGPDSVYLMTRSGFVVLHWRAQRGSYGVEDEYHVLDFISF
jgi:hypothetical protein